ncbi:MAG: polyphosphate polymerase domain-containing protein [Christensenellales bacterium]|nr:polyphosphate polymerase domain-containing protein [Christensenellales bacterium]
MELRNQLPARHELKYFIHPAEMEALRRRLRPVLRPDAHCVNGKPYTVRSLYFDDIDDSAYYDKLSGVMHRDKYRIRIYGYSDQEIFLERKRKMGDLIQKSSTRITRRLCNQMIKGDPKGLFRSKSPLVQDLYVQMRTRLLRPSVIVDYEREAWLFPVQNVRITFDTHLRSGLSSTELFDPAVATVSPRDNSAEILEVKYDNFMPDFIAGLLDSVRAERSAISKYVLCRRFEPLN